MDHTGPPESVPPKPSETFDGHWIQATDRTGSHRIGGGVGKWMIFPQASELDSQWEKIRIATENGQLGFAAKVSTALHIQGFPGSEGKGLICVYTSDWRDQEDVMRVREALRQLGFTNKLYYKTDDDTYAGVYRFTGHTNISKYQA